MTDRRFLGAMFLAGALIVLAAAVAVIAYRGEDTRQDVYRVSVCSRAAEADPDPADVAECARIRRIADQARTVSDACIIQRKTLRSGWYERITRCPPVNAAP